MKGDTEGIDLSSVSTSSPFKSSGTFSGKRKIILASANPWSARPTRLQSEHYVRIALECLPPCLPAADRNVTSSFPTWKQQMVSPPPRRRGAKGRQAACNTNAYDSSMPPSTGKFVPVTNDDSVLWAREGTPAG